MDLKDCRAQIDEIDNAIVELFKKRMHVAQKVAEYKVENELQVFDRAREEEKLRSIRSMVENEEDALGVSELFRQIMCISRKRQYRVLEEKNAISGTQFMPVEELYDSNTRVVYQGDRGAYSQLAMMAFFGESMKGRRAATFRDAMCSIEEGSADYAVLPIENSTAGEVSEIYDLLAEFENYIVGEIVIPIRHCLMAVPGASLQDIKKVLSHPQSLRQSSRFLDTHPDWQQVPVLNNAFAASAVAKEGDISQAAIASSNAAREYGLEILEDGINHQKDNSTRFIIVSGRKMYCKNAGKISICFELPNESGSLYRVLSHFIFNGLNMVKIESRPIPGRRWEYSFFLDFEGNLGDVPVINALRGVREETLRLRVLGNY